MEDPAADDRTATGTTVLVVEDEPGLADLYTAWIGDRYDTLTAYGGEEAIEQLGQGLDVVLLDRRMYDVSGDVVLEEITRRDLDCRVAMVTAVEPDFDVIEMGFDDYLTKPVSQRDLLAVIESLLAIDRYDEAVAELYGLCSKRSALEQQMASSELDGHEGYQRLHDRIDRVRAEVDAALDSVGSSEFETLFRRLEAEWAPGGAG